ncbi:SRPBCC family protein [Streptomyces rimosus]|uniref:SRPBCC family protein n=1 Tax=Streptomyces rimosus TaxID=1927 RepID=UPI00067BB12D|nr:SRPBCC family protein [Streptomyces rimosus]
MAERESHVVECSMDAKGPAGLAFDLMADVSRWPQYFSAVVHTERAEAEPAEAGAEQDRVTVWALRGGDAVRHWTSHRTVDRAALRIGFKNETAPPGLDRADGEWTFTDTADGTTIGLRHRLTPAEGTPDVAVERLAAEFEAAGRRQLAELTTAVERVGELGELTLDFEDPLFVCGTVEDVYRMLYEADQWPVRLAHVARLDMTENVPGIQFFDMVSVSPDGKEHSTRSVRVCLSHDRIVYKQVSLPPLLEAHTGHWAFSPAPEGLVVSARHTVVIKPSALHLLGEGTTVADARRYLRRVLGNNSMTNLRMAKSYAEEKAINGKSA